MFFLWHLGSFSEISLSLLFIFSHAVSSVFLSGLSHISPIWEYRTLIREGYSFPFPYRLCPMSPLGNNRPANSALQINALNRWLSNIQVEFHYNIHFQVMFQKKFRWCLLGPKIHCLICFYQRLSSSMNIYIPSTYWIICA